jgi:26S proteasome regulatory subunit N11
MNMQRIQQMLAGMQGRGGQPDTDAPVSDTSEKIQISSLSLLKMLKHGALYLFI